MIVFTVYKQSLGKNELVISGASMEYDKSHRGNASQFYVAAELCRRGYAAVVTMGNCPNTDILCSNKDGTRFVHIQVKTFNPSKNKTCSVGIKAEKDYSDNFFWIISGIPEPEHDDDFVYYIIPSNDMSKNVKECFNIWLEKPGIRVEKHNPDNKVRSIDLPPKENLNGWNIEKYKNRWDLIENILK